MYKMIIFKLHIVFEIKKNTQWVYLFYMVTRTGFEPVNACVKGMWVNRFSNGPYMALEAGLEPATDRLTADCSTNWAIQAMERVMGIEPT